MNEKIDCGKLHPDWVRRMSDAEDETQGGLAAGSMGGVQSAIKELEYACRLYCLWYDTGKPEMSASGMAYELVTFCRCALGALKDVEKHEQHGD